MRSSARVQHALAYVLHARDFRETGRIIELFSREHGRLTAFGRGIRGPRSRLAPLLQPFAPLLVSWSGRGEAVTLTGTELCPRPTLRAALPAGALMSAWYLNELVLKLTSRHDAVPDLFDAYEQALDGLTGAEVAATLRRFEKQMLDHLGYGLDFSSDAETGEAVDPAHHYRFRAGHGFMVAEPAAGTISGAALQAMAGEDFSDLESVRSARAVLRLALDHALEGRELATREVARALARAVPTSAASSRAPAPVPAK